MGENLADVLNSIEVDDSVPDEEQYIDPEQTVVTKVKRCVFKTSFVAFVSSLTCIST
jgi:hypothetical protein